MQKGGLAQRIPPFSGKAAGYAGACRRAAYALHLSPGGRGRRTKRVGCGGKGLTRIRNPSPALAALGHPLPLGEGKRERLAIISTCHSGLAAARRPGMTNFCRPRAGGDPYAMSYPNRKRGGYGSRLARLSTVIAGLDPAIHDASQPWQTIGSTSLRTSREARCMSASPTTWRAAFTS